MFSEYTTDSASNSQNLNLFSILSLYKQNLKLNVPEITTNHAKLTQKQITKNRNFRIHN